MNFDPGKYKVISTDRSSNVRAVAFSRASDEYPLAVAFDSGTYVYKVQEIKDPKTGKQIGVPGASSMFLNLEFGGETKDGSRKDSVGAFFYKNIRGKCAYEKVADKNVFQEG